MNLLVWPMLIGAAILAGCAAPGLTPRVGARILR